MSTLSDANAPEFVRITNEIAAVIEADFNITHPTTRTKVEFFSLD